MASFAGAGVAFALLALAAGAVADGRESGDFDRERVCITSKHAQSKTSRKTSQKFDSCSLHSLGQLPMRADESESVGTGLQPRGSQKATSVHRMQHRVAKPDRFVPQFTERNTGLQNSTGSSWPHLRTALRSIRPSAVSGRASSSFTSVGGNTSQSKASTPRLNGSSARCLGCESACSGPSIRRR